MRLLDVQWQPRIGVTVMQVKTYSCGVGSEYVYCYSYSTYIEMAELKHEQRFRIKVGSAKGDPIAGFMRSLLGTRLLFQKRRWCSLYLRR